MSVLPILFWQSLLGINSERELVILARFSGLGYWGTLTHDSEFLRTRPQACVNVQSSLLYYSPIAEIQKTVITTTSVLVRARECFFPYAVHAKQAWPIFSLSQPILVIQLSYKLNVVPCLLFCLLQAWCCSMSSFFCLSHYLRYVNGFM